MRRHALPCPAWQGRHSFAAEQPARALWFVTSRPAASFSVAPFRATSYLAISRRHCTTCMSVVERGAEGKRGDDNGEGAAHVQGGVRARRGSRRGSSGTSSGTAKRASTSAAAAASASAAAPHVLVADVAAPLLIIVALHAGGGRSVQGGDAQSGGCLRSQLAGGARAALPPSLPRSLSAAPSLRRCIDALPRLACSMSSVVSISAHSSRHSGPSQRRRPSLPGPPASPGGGGGRRAAALLPAAAACPAAACGGGA